MPVIEQVKRHGVTISLSTVATLLPVLGVVWFLIQPALVNAVAADLNTMIDAKQQPLQNAFKEILQSDINKLRRRIAKLEFKEAHSPRDWTEEDADELEDLRIELEALISAKEALE